MEWNTPIFCYKSQAGNNKISEWYQQLSPQEKSDADEFLKIMRKLTPSSWGGNDYKSNLSPHTVGELRWPSEKKQHRLLGYLDSGRYYAVLGCIHKQRVYTPADALDTADKRRKHIENGLVTTEEYDF